MNKHPTPEAEQATIIAAFNEGKAIEWCAGEMQDKVWRPWWTEDGQPRFDVSESGCYNLYRIEPV